MVLAAFAASFFATAARAVVGGAGEDGPITRQVVQVGICSGVVLASDVVLTAGHCATGDVHWHLPSGEMGAAATAEAHVSPRYNSKAQNPWFVSIDLALLRLTADLAPSLTPVRLSGEPARVGETVKMSGYGESTAGDPRTRGALRSVNVEIFEPFGTSDWAIWMSHGGQSGACTGDSGGAVSRGELVIAIITSILGPCGHQTRAVLVGPQRDWIDATLKEWGRKTDWE